MPSLLVLSDSAQLCSQVSFNYAPSHPEDEEEAEELQPTDPERNKVLVQVNVVVPAIPTNVSVSPTVIGATLLLVGTIADTPMSSPCCDDSPSAVSNLSVTVAPTVEHELVVQHPIVVGEDGVQQQVQVPGLVGPNDEDQAVEQVDVEVVEDQVVEQVDVEVVEVVVVEVLTLAGQLTPLSLSSSSSASGPSPPTPSGGGSSTGTCCEEAATSARTSRCRRSRSTADLGVRSRPLPSSLSLSSSSTDSDRPMNIMCDIRPGSRRGGRRRSRRRGGRVSGCVQASSIPLLIAC